MYDSYFETPIRNYYKAPELNKEISQFNAPQIVADIDTYYYCQQ